MNPNGNNPFMGSYTPSPNMLSWLEGIPDQGSNTAQSRPTQPTQGANAGLPSSNPTIQIYNLPAPGAALPTPAPSNPQAHLPSLTHLPDDIANAVRRLLQPGGRAYTRGRLNRVWLRQAIPEHIRRNNNTLAASSPLRQYSEAQLRLPQGMLNWLLDVNSTWGEGAQQALAPYNPPPGQAAVTCDETLSLGTYHGGDVYPCRGGIHGEREFRVCSRCRDRQPSRFSSVEYQVFRRGVLAPACEDCADRVLAVNRRGMNGCMCDTQWLCGGCRTLCLRNMAAAWERHVADQGPYFCWCGRVPDVRCIVRRCTACMGFVIAPDPDGTWVAGTALPPFLRQ